MHDYLSFEESIDVQIRRLDGRVYSFKESGIGVRDLVVSSPKYKTEYDNPDGMDGLVDMGTSLDAREIYLKLYFIASMQDEYSNKRDEVFRLLDSREPFYLSESRTPHKRWKVKLQGSFSPEQFWRLGFFEINLLSPSPYAESIVSTLDKEQTDVFYQVETEESIQYVFETETFFIWNNGDVDVNPRYQWADLKITYQGPSESLRIKNISTGDEWLYDGTTIEGDTIVIDGIKSYKNTVESSIFGSTNRKIITLAPGRNDFEVIGATGPFSISFDFRFYYI